MKDDRKYTLKTHDGCTCTWHSLTFKNKKLTTHLSVLSMQYNCTWSEANAGNYCCNTCASDITNYSINEYTAGPPEEVQ